MIRLRYKIPPYYFLVFLLVVFWSLAPIPKLPAGNTGDNGRTGVDDKKTFISADTFISDSEPGMAVFVGNVTLKQNNTTIKTNKLIIYYQKDRKKPDKQVKSIEAIQKIEAKGRVDIRFDDIVAKTSQAVYTKKNQMIVLTGPGSSVKKGSHSISGSKIIFNLGEKSIRVAGNGDHRVHAIFFQEKNQ